uniref:Glucose acyltransferase n=1 Tax=Solanum tuberosum TaxID=4113 RepID=M1BZY1_SOLTU
MVRFIVFLLLLLVSHVVSSHFIVESLPGFEGKLPFTLETGYIGVGQEEKVQLFYFFIESERDPQNDPLMLWLTGGPGCSGLSTLLYEMGPLTFDYANSSGNFPKLELNSYSWTKVANIIFIDQPAGTGYSYANTSEAYNCSDTLSVTLTYEFLRKWLMDHPKYLKNPLYVSGSSYAGFFVPPLTRKIYDGIEVGDKPQLNIKGYILGNAQTDRYIDVNGKVKYANHMALISEKIYQSAKENCNENYIDIDPHNTLCLNDLQKVTRGTTLEWVRCNESMRYRGKERTESYAYDVPSAIDYHRHLTNKSCRALIYSGDHDMIVPHLTTEEWIETLKLPIVDDWEPWIVDAQVAGYKMKYLQNDYELTYATVKGAGHTAAEYKPEQCLSMVDRWFSGDPL